MQSECHPEREVYRKTMCKACYFKDYRKGKSARSKISDIFESEPARSMLREEIAKACSEYEVRYNNLKRLGKLPTLDEGNGERAKEIWAELDQIYTRIKNQLPTPNDKKDE